MAHAVVYAILVPPCPRAGLWFPAVAIQLDEHAVLCGCEIARKLSSASVAVSMTIGMTAAT